MQRTRFNPADVLTPTQLRRKVVQTQHNKLTEHMRHRHLAESGVLKFQLLGDDEIAAHQYSVFKCSNHEPILSLY